MDLQTRDRATADVAPLPAGQPGVRLPGDRPGARPPTDRLSPRWVSRASLAWAGAAALIALAIARDAGVQGVGALPPAFRVGAAVAALFGVCGYGPTVLLLPEGLRRHLGLWILPIGAATSMLALTVLGLLHVPLAVSLPVVVVASAGLGIYAVRAHGRPALAPPGELIPRLIVPL